MAGPVRARLSAAEGRRFAFPVAAAFLALGGLLWWRGHGTGAWICAAVAGALTVAGVVMPTALGPIQRAWMGFALVLSRITTPIFMGLVFFLVITPIGVGLRGPRPLHLHDLLSDPRRSASAAGRWTPWPTTCSSGS